MIKEIISSLIGVLVGELWLLLCRKESSEYFSGTEDVSSVQESLLLKILEKNRNSVFGRKHGFEGIKSVRDYQQKVPLSTYADYVPYIERLAGGEKNVLTSEDVLMFELSSGSTSASKFIPYTSGLKEEFQRGLKVWITDMARNFRGLFHGASYWSVSPVTDRKKSTDGGVPIGFEEDSEYFGRIENLLLSILFAVPGEVKKINDMQSFRYVTLLFLMKSKSLSFISVWNPTFLTLLFENFREWFENLTADLKSGSINTPGPLETPLKVLLEKRLGRNPSRAKDLEDVWARYKDSPELTLKVWPRLSLISCWTSSHASAFIPDIERLFPAIPIQGKGLLATECFVSLPIYSTGGSLLSYRSHFFEFIEHDESASEDELKIRTAARLEKDKIYSVVVTTSGGFYRYQMHDLVACRRHYWSCPIIEFLGKADKVSDYFGEKVNEFHVGEVLGRIFVKMSLKPFFYMVAPEDDGKGCFFYVLYLDADLRGLDDAGIGRLITDFENGLRKNYHYDYCRKLGQLDSPRLFIVENGTGSSSYIEACRMMGQRTGDIKPVILHPKTGWSKRFSGACL